MSTSQRRMLKAWLVCTALIVTGCAHQNASFTTTDNRMAERQMAAINWDEIMAPTSAVTRSNAFLIMMR